MDDVVAVQILDRYELELPALGRLVLKDAETGQVIDSDVLTAGSGQYDALATLDASPYPDDQLGEASLGNVVDVLFVTPVAGVSPGLEVLEDHLLRGLAEGQHQPDLQDPFPLEDLLPEGLGRLDLGLVSGLLGRTIFGSSILRLGGTRKRQQEEG